MKYKSLGKTGFNTSVIGFGGYRISYNIPAHEEALRHALNSGVNLIDTSANYADGGSEILIGKVVNDLVSQKKLERDSLYIVTKGGYMQGNNLELARQRKINGNPYSDIVECAPDLNHCIHPDFLKDQITASLERMKMDYVDCYLLHNPEYFLNYEILETEEELLTEYYARIQKAFEYLETEVEAGRIRSYGISSNTFGLGGIESDFTALGWVLDGVLLKGLENFSVIQFPMNLVERGAWKNESSLNDGKTVLTLAAEHNLGVLINRPLNGIRKNRIFRLTEFEVTEDRSAAEVDLLIESLRAKEIEMKSEYVVPLQAEASEKRAFVECLSIASFIGDNKERFKGVTHFHDISSQFLIPRINYVIKELYEKYKSDSLRRKLNAYGMEAQILIDSYGSLLAQEHNKGLRKYHTAIDNSNGGIWKGQPLSRKAVAMINSTPQVSSTLVGMRSVPYVNDMLLAADLEPAENPKLFWQSKSKN